MVVVQSTRARGPFGFGCCRRNEMNRLIASTIECNDFKHKLEMNTQSRCEASSSGSYSNAGSSTVAKPMPHHVLYPMITTPSEGRDSQVKWIGLHPLDMVERVVSMTMHSAHARSATNSIDVGLFMKRIGAATTSPNAEATGETDERCKSLVRSILDVRNKDMKDKEALMEMVRSAPSSTVKTHIAVSQCPGINDSIQNKMKGPSMAQVNNAPKPSLDIFQATLSNWLIQNWTNPFPDTIQLENLATHLIRAQCIVVNAKDAQVFVGKSFEECQRCMMRIAIKKIETYLVNVRLRKWRKSIEDAFDLVSPCHNMFSLLLVCYFSHPCMKFFCIRGVQHGFSSKILVVYTKERHCDPLKDGTQMNSLVLMLAILYR
jgi:hypothetical protein